MRRTVVLMAVTAGTVSFTEVVHVTVDREGAGRVSFDRMRCG